MTNSRFSSLARRVAALFLIASAAPTTAQSLPLGAAVSKPYAAFSKSDAILGGAPSALQAILGQQSGTPIASMLRTAAVSFDGANPLDRDAVFPVARPSALSDRPDVFGSIALSVSRTSLDRRWNTVSRGPVGAGAGAYAAAVAHMSPLERVDAVNRYVNRRVEFASDITQYGVADRWASAGETLRRGRGDCEDYAIAKLQLLRRAGFAEQDLYLVILRDLSRSADHAVLVVRAEGRLLVLDNGTDRIVDSATIADYRPIFTFSGDRAWTHGYRRAAPPVIIASTERPTRVALASADPVEPAARAN